MVQRLRAAGAVIVAKTNMSEFAFSGVGANPHFGTPGNPSDRARVPGGSTSGGAVAVADGMCEIAIGTDTGGSTRIPAALCGIVGWKPSKQRVPTDGAFPLSFTLDSIGPMARTVADCALADAVMAGEAAPSSSPRRSRACGSASGRACRSKASTKRSSAAWSRRSTRLGQAGVRSATRRSRWSTRWSQVNAKGGFAPAEAYSIHRERLQARRRGRRSERPRAHRARRHRARRPTMSRWRRRGGGWCGRWTRGMATLDALVLPTTPIVAPTLAEVATPEEFGRKNALLLRNTDAGQFLRPLRDLAAAAAAGRACRRA